MDFNKLLENKPLLYGIIGAIVLVLAFSIVVGVVSSNKSGAGKSTANEKGLS